MLNLITGGAGCGKTFEMMNRIESAVKNGRDVLVVIPDQFSFEFDRNLYERLGAELFNRINVLSFARISKEIFIRHGGIKGRYADDIVKNVMMFRTITELASSEGLGFYNRQAEQLSFVESGLEIVKELTVSGITPERFLQCAERADESVREKASDIGLIYSEYCRMLAERGYKDGEGDISEAAARAVRYGYFRGKTIFIDAFKSFTADEYAMLDAMIADSESVTVCLTTEDRTSANYSVFETVNKTVNRLKRSADNYKVKINTDMLDLPLRFKAPELAFFSRNVLRNIREKYDGDCQVVKIYRSSDIYGEGDFVCSEIRRLVMENGFRYSDIAVVARQKEIYSSVMESAFERYGIPFYTDESFTAAHKSLFIFVKTALKLAADSNASSEDWLRYMKTGIPGLTDEEIAAIEDHCYKWSVDGKMWSEPFPYDDEKSGAEQVRIKVTEPIFKLREACADADGRIICSALLDYFDNVGVIENICAVYDGCTTEDAAALSAVRELKQLWELLCNLLETLSRALESTKLSLSEFSGLFSSAVGRLRLSAPPQTLDCVRFAAAHTARLSNVKAVFVIGVNEGMFPYAAKQSGLLSDRDRLALEDAGITLSGNAQDKLAEERFAAYSAVSSASDRLYISYAQSDVSGKALYPSVIIGQAEEMFGSGIISSFEERGLLSFCATPEAAYYQYVQNYRRDDSDSASLYAALDSIPEYSSRMKYLRDIENSAGHSLSPETGRRLFGKTVRLSASRFEDYSRCPFMYYCKKGLKLYTPQKIDMDKPSRGTAIHNCLCEILRSFGKDSFSAMSREEIYTEVKKNLDEYYRSSAVGGDYGKTRRYKAAFSRLSDTVTDILVRIAEEFRQNEFVPQGFEYTLSRDGDEEPLKLVTPSGITVYFDGMIDRIDVYESEGKKYIRVVDYKSGVKEFKFIDLLYGVNMQMLLYLFALTDVDHRGAYSGNIPAGVLYMPAKDAVPGLGRNEGDEAVRGVFRDTYKMKGIVLMDDDVITAMEKDCGGEFIPVTKTRDGYSRYSKLVTAKQLENLRKYSYALLGETAEKLHKGKIDAVPLMTGKNSLPCEYCDYRTVCGEYPPRRVRIYADNSKEIIENIMNGKEEENERLD